MCQAPTPVTSGVSAGLVKPDVDYRKAYTLEALKGVRVLP